MIRRSLVFLLFLATTHGALGQSAQPFFDRLSKLRDVSISNPQNTQVLTYDSAITKWKNADATGGGTSFIADPPLSLSAGHLSIDLSGYVPTTRTVNGHALSGNVTVTPGDLGLVIGTNVEAWDTQLDSLAGLSYIGNGLKVVRVNTGETGFELAAPATGTVTTFSAGNLSPIFTTSVANATTAPALSFTLSTAGAHTFLGNNTAGTAAPVYVQPAFSDLSGTATSGQIPALGGNPTVNVGLSAVNGTATTYLRSDGAPALSQAIAPIWSVAHTWTLTDAVTNASTVGITVNHDTSGTPAIGLGSKIVLGAEDSTTNDQPQAFIETHWSDVTHATRTAYIGFSAASLGVDPSTDRFFIFGSGGASLYTKQDSGPGVLYVESGYQAGSAAPVSGLILQSDGTKYAASPMTWPTTAPATGKILRSDGVNIVASTPTYPNAAGTAGKIVQSDGTNFVVSTPTWPTAAGTTGYQIESNGTNFIAYPALITNSSTGGTSGYAADTYLSGSSCVIAAGDWKAKGQYRCIFDMVKTAAGTATPIITVRMGTAGTTADAAVFTLTFGAGTLAADTGRFEVDVTLRSVGATANIGGIASVWHHLAATGLTTTGASGFGEVVGANASFNTTTATTIGLSFNGGTSFAGTNVMIQSQLTQ